MADKGLVIIHVDGLSYHYLQEALAQGKMPYVRRLMDKENYEALPYRVGIPSTTPFAQAGILYGDNSEIPSFRWWDKQSGLLVAFGGNSSFRRVAHKYFRGCDPLTKDGACIAACYPAGAIDTFGLAYGERDHDLPTRHHSARDVLLSYTINPLNLVDWLGHGLNALWYVNLNYWRTRLAGRPAAKMYVVSDLLEELFLHHLTRFAARQAMEENYPVIYAGLYAYDETAHAFGPEHDYSFDMLKHVDHTIQLVGEKRHSRQNGARDYELIVLSDHGQVETVPFTAKYGCHVADKVAAWLPTYEVQEHRGKCITPPDGLDGHIVLTYAGGLAHFYFRDLSWRLDYGEITQRVPGLVEKIAATPGIDFVLLRDGASDLVVTREGAMHLDDASARDFLQRFDDAEIIARQLHKLNSFERSGDLIIFGEYAAGKQINFENQVGGHGSVGGEQLHPFVLAKREWKFDTTRVHSASDLYPLLKQLRDKLT